MVSLHSLTRSTDGLLKESLTGACVACYLGIFSQNQWYDAENEIGHITETVVPKVCRKMCALATDDGP